MTSNQWLFSVMIIQKAKFIMWILMNAGIKVKYLKDYLIKYIKS